MVKEAVDDSSSSHKVSYQVRGESPYPLPQSERMTGMNYAFIVKCLPGV